jgi:predicted NAD-dependent protein-ADP-ribosyltransferase YbiA (DUF1768 family)
MTMLRIDVLLMMKPKAFYFLTTKQKLFCLADYSMWYYQWHQQYCVTCEHLLYEMNLAVQPLLILHVDLSDEHCWIVEAAV